MLASKNSPGWAWVKVVVMQTGLKSLCSPNSVIDERLYAALINQEQKGN
jgi:hypothetical protein